MVLLEKPLCLRIGSKRFRLYQPCLGKIMLQRRLLDEIMNEDEEVEMGNEMLKTLVMVERHRDKVCELLAMYSFRDSKDCLDPFKTEERAGEFMELETSDLATLLTAIFAMPTASRVISEVGIDKENERKRSLADAKDTRGSYLCGGISIYGGILDHVMQRYGWSLQYALWGISAANLQLLTSDEQMSIYLTDDERKHVPSTTLAGKDTIDASDPRNRGKITDLLYGLK